MSERRYSDEEVARIFEQATHVDQTANAGSTGRSVAPTDQGMTLAQLMEIGREVGIAAVDITRAARALDLTAPQPTRRMLGFPIGVGRTVDLGRRMTEQEWERLVVELRDTFDARGSVLSDGSFRQWTNGNLQVLLEPTHTGHRLRMRTTNGQARSLLGGGLAALGVAFVVLLGLTLTGQAADAGKLMGVFFMGAIGAGLFAAGALRLPGWAKLRQRQMDALAAKQTAALAAAATDEPDPPAD
ncbi:MAG: hypothetical protein AB7R55_07660 [Gemmatimonadales bacterium]